MTAWHADERHTWPRAEVDDRHARHRHKEVLTENTFNYVWWAPKRHPCAGRSGVRFPAIPQTQAGYRRQNYSSRKADGARSKASKWIRPAASPRLAPSCFTRAFSGIVSGTKAEADARNMRCFNEIGSDPRKIACLAQRLLRRGQPEDPDAAIRHAGLLAGRAEGLLHGLLNVALLSPGSIHPGQRPECSPLLCV